MVSSLPDEQRYKQVLSRSLSWRDNLMITLSAVTPASSVFIILPSVVVALGGASVLVLAISAILNIFVGFCYAELSTVYPIAGGEYIWVARLCGRPTGFALFLLILVSNILVTGVIAMGTGEYLQVAFPAIHGEWIGAVVCLAAAVIGIFSIRINAFFTSIFLLVEIAAILVIVYLGFRYPIRGVSEFFQISTLNGMGDIHPGQWSALIVAIPIAFFAFNGFGTAIYYVEETKNATKNIAKIILLCLAITVLVEILPLAATIIGSPSITTLMSADHPFNYLLLVRGGAVINKLVSLGIAVAVINAVISIELQNTRLLFASARDLSWPIWISTIMTKVNEKTYTPIIATLCVGITSAITTLCIPFSWLITATSACIMVVFIFVAIAALRIRRKTSLIASDHVEPRQSYRMPLWPVAPILVIIMMSYISFASMKTELSSFLAAIITMLIGLIYYLIYLYPKRALRWTLLGPIKEEMEIP